MFGQSEPRSKWMDEVFDSLKLILAPINVENLHWALFHAEKNEKNNWVVHYVDTCNTFPKKTWVKNTGLKFTAFLASRGQSLTDSRGSSFAGIMKGIPQQKDEVVCGYAVMSIIADLVGKKSSYLMPGKGTAFGGVSPKLPDIADMLVANLMKSPWKAEMISHAF
jgi:hypothetical protein